MLGQPKNTGAPKDGRVLAPFGRARVFEPNFGRRPVAAAALADEIGELAERQFGVLPPGHDGRRLYPIFQPDAFVVLAGQAHRRGALLIAEEIGQGFQRRSEGGRGQRRIPPHAEIAGLELLAEQQAEIVASGALCSLFEQFAEYIQPKLQRRSGDHLRRDAARAENLVGVAAVHCYEIDQAGRSRCQHHRGAPGTTRFER